MKVFVKVIGVAVTSAATLVATACSSSSSSGSSPGSTQAAVVTSATSSAASGTRSSAAVPTAAPTQINITVPLSGPLQKKTVAWMECELPACQVYTPGFKEAAAALGWNLKVFPLDQTNPGAGIQSAINAGVDYIAYNSVSPAALKPQIAAAKAKGIMLFNCFDTTAPEPASNDEFVNCGDSSYFVNEGGQLANWAISDAQGSAHILAVNVPSIPVLNSIVTGAKNAVAAASGSSLSELDLAVTDVGSGTIPAKVVTYLRTHPDIDYVYFTFADLATGVVQAMRSADLAKKVKIVGISANSNALNAVVDGSNAAWTIQPTQSVGWVMLDAMARYQLGEDSAAVQTMDATLQSFVVDSKDTAQQLLKEDGGSWPGPDGYQAQFKALWGLK